MSHCWRFALPILVLLAASSVRAQEAANHEAMRREMEELRQRVKLLEERLAAPTATAAPRTPTATAQPSGPGVIAPNAGIGGSASGAAAGEKTWYDKLQIHAFADVYYAFNLNRPGRSDEQGNFTSLPGANVGTTAKRANDADLNLAAIDISVAPEPVGFHVTGVYGTGTHILHLGEPLAGPEPWVEMIYQACVSAKVPLGSGLIVEAGIFPSHIGYEGFFSKDNPNYTRGWAAELSPYYETGVKVGYDLTPSLSAKVFALNGWQLIRDNNDAKSVGTQLAFASEKLDLTFNTFAGPELPDDNTHWRLFGELIPAFRPVDWITLAVQLDLGYQEEPTGVPDALWHAYTGIVRVAPLEWLAFAVRGDLFRDPDDGISGAKQTLSSITGTIELKPVDHLSVKLETRYDHSTAEVFADRHTLADGTGDHRKDELIFLVGAVVWF